MRVVSHPDRPQSNQAHLTVLHSHSCIHTNRQLSLFCIAICSSHTHTHTHDWQHATNPTTCCVIHYDSLIDAHQ